MTALTLMIENLNSCQILWWRARWSSTISASLDTVRATGSRAIPVTEEACKKVDPSLPPLPAFLASPGRQKGIVHSSLPDKASSCISLQSMDIAVC